MLNTFVMHQNGLMQALLETFLMLLYSGVITLILGLVLGILLYALSQKYLTYHYLGYHSLSFILNALRSIPFLIFIFVLIPINRMLFKTSFGLNSAILPLSLVAISLYARFIEQALKSIDFKIIEQGQAMGANKLQIIKYFLIPTIMEDIVLSFTNTCISILAYSTVMGVIGAGGLGDYAFRYGYQEYDYQLMYLVIVIFIFIVFTIQNIGYFIASKFSLQKGEKI